MNVAIIVATYGDREWRELALSRAVPSALAEANHRTSAHVSHYPNLTLAAARNQAVSEAITEADWLCFLDADDELEPGYLDAMDYAYEHYPVGVVGETVPPPLLVPLLRRVKEGSWSSPPTVPNKGRWPAVNEAVIGTLVNRLLFERVGGFREHTGDGTPITMYEDWDLWLRCWDAGAKLVYTDAVYRAYVNPDGRNTNAHESQVVYDAIWADHEARVRTTI